jgi:hypothetical protein
MPSGCSHPNAYTKYDALSHRRPAQAQTNPWRASLCHALGVLAPQSLSAQHNASIQRRPAQAQTPRKNNRNPVACELARAPRAPQHSITRPSTAGLRKRGRHEPH